MASSCVLSVLVILSLVALSTQLKCYTCPSPTDCSANLGETTCSGDDEVCAIAQVKGDAGSRVFRGCVKSASCQSGNTRDLSGVDANDAKRLEAIFATGKTRCVPCTTDLCNGGAPPEP